MGFTVLFVPFPQPFTGRGAGLTQCWGLLNFSPSLKTRRCMEQITKQAFLFHSQSARNRALSRVPRCVPRFSIRQTPSKNYLLYYIRYTQKIEQIKKPLPCICFLLRVRVLHSSNRGIHSASQNRCHSPHHDAYELNYKMMGGNATSLWTFASSHTCGTAPVHRRPLTHQSLQLCIHSCSALL